VHVSRLLLDLQTDGIDEGDDGPDHDLEPAGGAQETGYLAAFAPAGSDVVVLRAVPVHQHGVPGYPDLGIGVTFGVDTEHPARADDEVVEVRARVGEGHRMDDMPGRLEPLELLGDELFALGTHPPGPLVGVNAK
jgi:hypothetical protein